MIVRACTSQDEMRAAFAPIWHYFGQLPPDDEALERFARILEPQRVHAGFDGDAVVAGSGAYSFDLAVPGGQVKAMGLTIVGVLPTHRRRGYLRSMMRSQIDAATRSPLCVLKPWRFWENYGVLRAARSLLVKRLS